MIASVSTFINTCIILPIPYKTEKWPLSKSRSNCVAKAAALTFCIRSLFVAPIQGQLPSRFFRQLFLGNRHNTTLTGGGKKHAIESMASIVLAWDNVKERDRQPSPDHRSFISKSIVGRMMRVHAQILGLVKQIATIFSTPNLQIRNKHEDAASGAHFMQRLFDVF